MSIHNLLDKIKSKIYIDNITIIYLFIVIGVGLSAFGLGRLSISNLAKDNSGIKIIQTGNSNSKILSTESLNTDVLDIKPIVIEKNYVASKNGKLYYARGCLGAKRIKSINEVWFATSSDAQKSGYRLASSCK